MSGLTLITFPPSLDSEFSRFLLAHYDIPHTEQRHTLIFSTFATLRHGRTPRFPLLYNGSLRADTIPEMIEYFEPRCPPQRRLLPDGSKVDSDDWRLFHSTLGSATTVFAYYHLVPLREVMVGPLSEGTPPVEVAAVHRAYPVFATLLRTLLWLTSSREVAKLATIRTVMGQVDERLADGRRYLLGDHFTLADMAFAVAAAPVVWPAEYGGALPPLEATPPALRSVISEMRQRPSGAYALRIYRDHRAGGIGL